MAPGPLASGFVRDGSARWVYSNGARWPERHRFFAAFHFAFRRAFDATLSLSVAGFLSFRTGADSYASVPTFASTALRFRCCFRAVSVGFGAAGSFKRLSVDISHLFNTSIHAAHVLAVEVMDTVPLLA